MADAQPQTPVILGAERGGDVLEAVVAARRAAFLQFRHARSQVELVVHDQHFTGLNLIEAGQLADRQPGAVHERERLEQPQLVGADAGFGDQAVEARFALQPAAGQTVGQVVDQPEAGIVTGLFVFGAGVAEADDQAY